MEGRGRRRDPGEQNEIWGGERERRRDPGGRRDCRGEERKAEPPPTGGCSVGLNTVFNRRRYSSFSISVLEYIPVCFCWFSFLVQFHVPSRVCIDSLFESLFWRIYVLYLLVKFFDFFSWFTAVIFFFQRLYD